MQVSTNFNADELLKRNAAFLIEASEEIEDYDSDCLNQMKAAFDNSEYNDVIDLAYIHDRVKRGNKPHASEYADEIVSELSSELEAPNTPLQWCVSALRILSKDLTYENRELAKQEIRKIISVLE
jgi:tRNA uridine 5-carbamoylmethylation protein Kti12